MLALNPLARVANPDVSSGSIFKFDQNYRPIRISPTWLCEAVMFTITVSYARVFALGDRLRSVGMKNSHLFNFTGELLWNEDREISIFV